MQRRSQGNENLAEVQLDITAFERSNRRGASRGSTRNSEEPRMETGEGSGEARRGAGSPTNPTSAGGANSNSGGPNADHGNGEVRGGARHYSNPEIRNIPAWNERDVDDGDNVRIGSYDEPGTRVVRTGIVVPRTPNDFNVKQGLMNGVKDLGFRGRPSENPLDHLEAFDRLCNLYKTGNIPLDTVRMIMFSYSLADDAADWERQISSELVSTWEDVKREFLKAFFPKEKTTRIRGEIIAFKQRRNETFAQAWDRMKRYLRSCPHHGFTRDSILGIFYKGCNASNRMHLDSASGGSFANRTVKDGENIVADLAKGSSQVCDDEDDYEPEDSYEKVEGKVLKDMHRKLDLVLKGQTSRKEVSFVKEADPTEGYYDPDYDNNEEMCYVENNQGYQNRGYSNQGYNNNNGQNFRNNYGGQGGQQPRFNNSYQGNQRTFPPNNNFNSNRQQPYNTSGGNFQRPSFQPNQSYDAGNQPNKNFSYQDRMEKLENLIARAMEDSNKVAIEYGKRIDSLGEAINRRMDSWDEKLDNMSERVSTLERNLADVATLMKPNGKRELPGKPEPNPKEYCQYLGDEEEDEDAAWKQGPSSELLTFNVNEVYDTHSLDDSSDSNGGETIITPPQYYTPLPPFPGTTERAKKQSKAYADIVRALRLMEGTEELEEILAQDSRFSRDIRWIEDNKEWYEDKSHPLPIRSSQQSETPGDLEQVRYVMEKLGESESFDKVEKKNSEILEYADANNDQDSRRFGIPCFVNGAAFRKCILDPGLMHNIMPLDLAKAIGITKIDTVKETLVLADWTTRKVTKYAANIPVTVEGYTTKANFLILKTSQANPGRVTFGRPFLEDCNAKFDIRNGLVSFRFGNNCCTLVRDSDIDVHGRKTNPSKMKFFQSLVAETKKHSSCLGGTIELGRKHRIVELVEEYELLRSQETGRSDDPGVALSSSRLAREVKIEAASSTQERENTRQGRNNRNTRKGKALLKGPTAQSVSFKTPPKAKTPQKGVETFEWRVKSKKSATPPTASKVSIDHDRSSKGKSPLEEQEALGDQADDGNNLEEGEIEPEDKQEGASTPLSFPN